MPVNTIHPLFTEIDLSNDQKVMIADKHLQFLKKKHLQCSRVPFLIAIAVFPPTFIDLFDTGSPWRAL